MSTNTLRHLKFSSRIVSFLARSKNITLNPKFNTMSGRSENCTTRMSGKTLDDILYPHIEPHKTGMLQVRFILTAMFLHKPKMLWLIHYFFWFFIVFRSVLCIPFIGNALGTHRERPWSCYMVVLEVEAKQTIGGILIRHHIWLSRWIKEDAQDRHPMQN